MQLKLKKGLTLNIDGAVENWNPCAEIVPSTCAIYPEDFHGITPKTNVKEGDLVKVGSCLLFDKTQPDLKITSPVAGKVKAVVRGERRKILRVEVETDASAPFESEAFDTASAKDSAAILSLLAGSGLLAEVRQRPYDIVPRLNEAPRDIFVTAFDLAPLAPQPGFGLMGNDAAQVLTKAVEVLSGLTQGKVYISVSDSGFSGAIKGAEIVEVSGKYPASNPGVQAANIAPVNKGETIWCMDIATLYKIGRLFSDGKVVSQTFVAVTGPEVATPCVVKTVEGASLPEVLAGRLKNDNVHKRVICGNVFTGTVENPDSKESYLHYPWRQITVIAEGDDADEFMGWASMAPSKMSLSRSFPGHFLHKLFRPDARLNGGRRAMIMSGEYDRVFPMDVMPEYLLKAIISRDIESMEKLGIYEVAPEDFAAAEYADTSKLPLQKIVREGLDFLRKELE